MLPTTEQILALSPDRAALVVARRTARPELWSGLGRSDAALWGVCEAADSYRVAVATADLRTRCGCESPRTPCRHALALLLLAAQDLGQLPLGDPPEDVAAWLGRRAARARAKPNAPARKKRSDERQQRVRAGVAALRTWLSDRAKVGLAELENQPQSFWQDAAKRLEDHQIRGLPERLMRLSERVGATPDWPAELLAELGRLALLVEAAERIDALPPGLQAEVRTLLGFSQREAEVLERGERTTDAWLVLGRTAETLMLGNGLRAERTWLLGRASARAALLLRYQHPSDTRGARGPSPQPGTIWHGELAWYSAAFPQRVALVAPTAEPEPLAPPFPGVDLARALEGWAMALAQNPFLDRALVLLNNIQLVRNEGKSLVMDEHGSALPLSASPHWWLHAVSGGHPITLAAEWDGVALTPIGAQADGAWHLPDP